MESKTLFGQLAIVSATQSVWSAAIRLPDSAIEVGEGGKKPSNTIASNGELYLIDREHLRPFSKIKTQLRRLGLKYGAPWLGGFAVPVDRLPELQEELDSITEYSKECLKEFELAYPTYCAEWLINPEADGYQDLIRNSQPEIDSILGKFKLSISIFKIEPATSEQEHELMSQALGLTDDLLEDLHDAARDFLNRKLKAGHKESATPRDKEFLRTVRDRIDGLAFLNGSLNAIVELLDDMLDAWTAKNLRGMDFYRLMAGAMVLADAKQLSLFLEEYEAEGSISGTCLDLLRNHVSAQLQNGENWEQLAGQPAPPPPKPGLGALSLAAAQATTPTQTPASIPAQPAKRSGKSLGALSLSV